MNRCNVLTAIDMLQFAKKVNLMVIESIETGSPLRGELTLEDVKTLQGECVSVDEAIDILEKAIEEDKNFPL